MKYIIPMIWTSVVAKVLSAPIPEGTQEIMNTTYHQRLQPRSIWSSKEIPQYLKDRWESRWGRPVGDTKQIKKKMIFFSWKMRRATTFVILKTWEIKWRPWTCVRQNRLRSSQERYLIRSPSQVQRINLPEVLQVQSQFLLSPQLRARPKALPAHRVRKTRKRLVVSNLWVLLIIIWLLGACVAV